MTRQSLVCAVAFVAFACTAQTGTRAVAAPKPTPTPTPTPTPPPHAVSCTDGTNGPGWITGIFPIPAGANTTVSTAIQVLPDSADARYYLNHLAATLRKQQSLQGMPLGATPPPVKPGQGTTLGQTMSQLVQSQSDATTLSAVLQRLEPTERGTTVDGGGNWGCHGLTPAVYRMLAIMQITTTTIDPNATPVPLPSSLPANVVASIQQNAGRRQTLTRRYFELTEQLTNQSMQKAWTIGVPFASWTPIATLTQSSR